MRKVKAATIYIASNIFYQLPPILLLPFLTHHLSQRDYGIVTLFIKMTTFLLPICTLGIKMVAKKGFYKQTDDDFKVFFTTSLLLPFLTLPVVGLLLWVFKDIIARNWDYPAQWLWAVPVFVGCRHAYLIALDYFRSLKKPVYYALLKNGSSLLEIGMTVTLITLFSMTYDGRILGIVGSKILFTVLALGLLFWQSRFRLAFNPAFARRIIAEGFVLLPILVAGIAFKLIDTFLVAYWLGAEATGIYGIALRIASAASLIQTGLLLATQPILMEQLSKPNPTTQTRANIAKYLLFEWILFLLAAFGLSYIAIPLAFPYLIDAKFNQALGIILPLSIGYVLLGMSQTLSIFFLFFENYRSSNIAILLGLAALVITSALLAPTYGLQGIAWATCLAYSVPVVWQLYHLPNTYPLPWRNGYTALLYDAKTNFQKMIRYIFKNS